MHLRKFYLYFTSVATCTLICSFYQQFVGAVTAEVSSAISISQNVCVFPPQMLFTAVYPGANTSSNIYASCLGSFSCGRHAVGVCSGSDVSSLILIFGEYMEFALANYLDLAHTICGRFAVFVLPQN